MLDRALVILDVETTGLDSEKDYIVELSMVKYDRILMKQNIYFQGFKVPIDIPAEVTAIHGITNDMLEDCPTFNDEYKNIISFLNGCDLGGYNVMFDISFLSVAFDRCGYIFSSDIKIIDVMKIFAKYEPRTLVAVYNRLTGLDLTDAHSSLADVVATKDVLHALIHKKFCGLDTDELVKLSDTDKIADYAGKFYYENGQLLFAFGKHRGKHVAGDINYCAWFLKTDFPAQSKCVLSNYLKVNKYV
jgi:DNA polymerase-3 subunit epsilon